MCFMIYHKAQQLQMELKQVVNDKIEFERINSLKMQICEIIQVFQDLFNVLTLIWIVENVVSIIILSYYLFCLLISERFSIINIIFCVYRFCVETGLLIIISVSASAVHMQMKVLNRKVFIN